MKTCTLRHLMFPVVTVICCLLTGCSDDDPISHPVQENAKNDDATDLDRLMESREIRAAVLALENPEGVLEFKSAAGDPDTIGIFKRTLEDFDYESQLSESDAEGILIMGTWLYSSNKESNSSKSWHIPVYDGRIYIDSKTSELSIETEALLKAVETKWKQ